jgi:hypothetical protein
MRKNTTTKLTEVTMSNKTTNKMAHIVTAVIMLVLMGGTTSLLLWPFITLKVFAVGIFLLFIYLIYVIIYYQIKDKIK